VLRNTHPSGRLLDPSTRGRDEPPDRRSTWRPPPRIVSLLLRGAIGESPEEVDMRAASICARAVSGVYFVKLLGGDGQASEAKLVLLK